MIVSLFIIGLTTAALFGYKPARKEISDTFSLIGAFAVLIPLSIYTLIKGCIVGFDKMEQDYVNNHTEAELNDMWLY